MRPAAAALLLCGGGAAPAGAAPRTVAVVGAGIGGGSFSYYWAREHPEDRIVVFDTRNYVGGRLRHATLHGRVVEIGGDAWSTAVNAYVVELAKELGGARARPRRGESGAAGGGIGIWQGDRIVPFADVLLRHPEALAKAGADEAGFVRKLKRNYAERGGNGTFRTVAEFTAVGGLDEYTATSAEDYFTPSIAPELLQFALEPLTRVIYDQGLAESHAFSSLVAVTSALGAASFDGGNSVLVERLINASAAELRLQTTVTAVARDDASGRYTVRYCPVGAACAETEADAVVLACPFEHANVTFTPPVRVEPREWRHWWVTVTRARGLNPTFFGLPKGASVPYEGVLTTENSSATIPFSVVQVEASLGDGTSLWKFFANDDVTPHLSSIFDGLSADPADTVTWFWPYTFPVLEPMPVGGPDRFQPLVLGPGLFHLNALESVASAMEGSIIAARNAALLLSQQ